MLTKVNAVKLLGALSCLSAHALLQVVVLPNLYDGIGGCGDGRSWFVIGKDLEKNKLLVAQGEDHPMLYSTRSLCTGVTWIGDAPIQPGETLRCTCKFRYRQGDQPADVTLDGDKMLITSLDPQRAVTPGQSAVLYLDERCIGGAVVESVLDAGVKPE